MSLNDPMDLSIKSLREIGRGKLRPQHSGEGGKDHNVAYGWCVLRRVYVYESVRMEKERERAASVCTLLPKCAHILPVSVHTVPGAPMFVWSGTEARGMTPLALKILCQFKQYNPASPHTLVNNTLYSITLHCLAHF